jgi:ElaB/YqjD/DUF883 family membrane-anchored ribosome-binding protein
MTTNAAEQTRKAGERAAAGIDAVAEQAKEVAHSAAALAQDAAGFLAEAGDAAVHKARQAGAQVRDIADEAYTRGTRASRSLAHSVAEHPLAALLIAGAVGYAVASLQRGRR